MSGLFTAVVVDADVTGPVPWLATGYVAGPSLADAVEAQGPLPADSLLMLAAGLAEGLEAIHAAGLVHRDLKPSNVLLAGDGPRVIDFGISRAAEASVLTQTGTVMGSPGFMSPEQAEGSTVGPASDVFSLGAVLTFAATGEGPFGTGSTPALMYRVVHHQPDTVRLPEQIRPLIERCLAKDPRERPTPTDLLAEFGAGQLAADWLPGPLTQVIEQYTPPGTTGPAGSPGSHGRTAGTGPPAAPTAAAPTGPTGPPTEAAFPIHPSAADRQPQRRKRRGLVWALLAAGLVVASAAAVLVPRAIRAAPTSQSQHATGTRSPVGSARPSQTGGTAPRSATPSAVQPPSPAAGAGSADPAARSPVAPSPSATSSSTATTSSSPHSASPTPSSPTPTTPAPATPAPATPPTPAPSTPTSTAAAPTPPGGG